MISVLELTADRLLIAEKLDWLPSNGEERLAFILSAEELADYSSSEYEKQIGLTAPPENRKDVTSVYP